MARRRSRLPLLLIAAIAAVAVGVLTGVLKLDGALDGSSQDRGGAAPAITAGPGTAPTAPPVDAAADSAMPESAEAAVIVRVVDGDTVVVRRDGRSGQETVRLAGIDTPETVKPNSPVECWGPEASERTKVLLPIGIAVRLEPDPTQGDTDRYGRLLRYLWLPSSGGDGTGTLVNLALVREGSAEAYRDQHARWQEFQDAQAAARSEGAGLWGAC